MKRFGKAVIVPSYACNQQCVYCYARPSVLGHHAIMSVAEMKSTIDFFAELQIETMTILGGEPLMYPYLKELVSYALQKGITSWIVTNGSEFCKNDLGHRLIDMGLKGGCISIFSMDEMKHDSITQKRGSFQLIYDSLVMIIQNKWPIYPMITIGDQTFENTYRDVSELIKLGFTTIYINYGVPNVFETTLPQYVSQPQILADYTYRLYQIQKEFNVRFVFNCEKNKVPICLFDSDMFADLYANNQIGYGCEIMNGNTIVVEPGGDVLGCSHWVGIPFMNIYKDYSTLTLISKDEFFQEWDYGFPANVRKMMDVYPFEKCSTCTLKREKKCYGGCKTLLSRSINFKTIRHGK